ncbi:MAG: OsmC family protein [Bacteroidetes bacterium]|nr:OsmC family protein [Bacteroidota bacterium]
MAKTITTWIKNHEFEASHEGNTIKIDGAAKNGHGPKALMLSALAGCSGIDMVDLLIKMRVPFFALSIEVEAEQTEEHPKVFKEIHILYKVQTDMEYEKKVRKAVNLSLEQYCGVAAMLRKNSPIIHKIEIY